MRRLPGTEPEEAYADGIADTASTCSFLDFQSRHTVNLRCPGYSNRKHTIKFTSGETQVLDEYECTQKQRAYERSVRESKTILAGYDAAIKAAPNATLENSMKEEFAAESVKLKKIEAEMKDFCKQTGRPVDSARTQVHAVKDDSGRIVNFGRSVSQKAVWANKKSR